MSMSPAQLEAEALALPGDERMRLADRLYASLDDGDDDDPDEVERAWGDEIRRRIDEYHAGGVETIPAAEVLAEARRPAR